MGIVCYLLKSHEHGSSEKMSGRISSLGIPVTRSTSLTRSGGTPLSAQRDTVLLLTEHPTAKSRCFSPRSANKMESDLLIGDVGCTTNNTSQPAQLRNPLTTEVPPVGILATMPKRAAKTVESPLVEIYQKRQPRRPHYLARLMELRNVSRRQMIEDLSGLDKSLLSRWLDKDEPSTPGRDWTIKLSQYFAVAPDYEPVDIFSDPDLDWLARLLRGRSAEEKDRIKAMIEAAFPIRRAG